MTHDLITQLERVGRRRRLRRWFAATCCGMAAVSLVAATLIGVDYALGVTDPLGRMLETILLLSLGLAIGRRWFRFVSAAADSPLQIAHEVERRHPELQDMVSSAWQFAQQRSNDPIAGSKSLRRAVVNRAAMASDDIDWEQLVSRLPLRQSALALAGAAMTIGVLVWWLPQALGIGLTRLVNPLSNVEWPREHDLQFVEPPLQLAAGQDLVLLLRDTRGALPASVTMHYRTGRQGQVRELTEALATKTDPLEIRLANVQQSLQFRATGGDHRTMPWQSLNVVVPPRVETWQLTVHPPAYTNLPAQTWDPKTPIFADSQFELHGYLDQPVAEVRLRSTQGRELTAQVGPAGRSFRIEPTDWRSVESETWSLHFTTAAGLQARSNVELALEVVVDQPPQVRILEPTKDLTVLPDVTVPLVIEVIDELAIEKIELITRRTDRAELVAQRVPLWQATDVAGEISNPRQQRVDFWWDLRPLSLAPGSVVEVDVEATDNRPAAEQPAPGRTARRLQITVVSEEELWRQIVEKQSEVVRALDELLRRQRALATSTTEWTNFPTWSIARRTNASYAALFEQRQIAAALSPGSRSLLGQLAELTQTMERNGLLRQATADRLQLAQERLQDLVDQPLAALDESLSELARQSQSTLSPAGFKPLLVDTAQQQAQVIDALDQLVDLLLPGNVLGQLEKQLRAIEQDQVALTDRCRVELADQILSAAEAAPAVHALVAAAAGQQRALSVRLGKFLLDLTEAAERTDRHDAPLAARMADTAALAKILGLETTIEEAAAELAQHRLGRSLSLQQQTLADLAKLLLRLAGRDVAGATERIEGLLLAERRLAILRRKLQTLQQELGELTIAQPQDASERLRDQRAQLAEQTARLASQLERMQIPAAAESTREAASQLRHEKLDSETTRKAEQQLETAQRQLTSERRQQQAALARLQRAQLSKHLRSLIVRQQAIRVEIGDLDVLQEQANRWNAAQQQSIGQLATRQSALRAEVALRAQQLRSLPVFTHLLNRCGEAMQRLEVRLQRTELGQPTQVLAEHVVGQLTQLADAIQQERANSAANSRLTSTPGQKSGQADDTAQLQTLQLVVGQLQLLKSLQADLQQKTDALEAQQVDGQLRTDVARELASQQRELTELARQLNRAISETLTETHDQELE